MPTLQQALANIRITKRPKAAPQSTPRPSGPRRVPLGTFETERRLAPAEGLDRPHPGIEPDAIDYRFAENYFAPTIRRN